MTAVGVPASGTAVAEGNRWSRWAALSGVVFGLVLALAVLMTAGEPDASNAAKVQAWDIKNKGLMGGSILVLMLAVVVGLYFLTWLYTHLGGKDSGWMGTLFLVGAVIFGLSGTVGAGLHAAIAQDAKHLSADSLQLMSSFDMNLNYPMSCVGLALMFLAVGFLIRRGGLLPGWLAWVSWFFALCAVSFFVGFVALLGSALWMIAVGAILAARSPAAS
jgi:hypothetical protein